MRAVQGQWLGGQAVKSLSEAIKMLRKQIAHDPADIFEALNRSRVMYLVVGGVAAIFHGMPRNTFDVDLAVKLDVENLKRLEHVLSEMGFTAKAPVSVIGLADPATRREWLQRKGMMVFSFVENRKPFRMVDIMVRPPRDLGRLYQQRVMVRHQGIAVPVIPVEALIKMKTRAGRVQDLEDVAYLRFAQQKKS
jgi:hypothetical protein